MGSFKWMYHKDDIVFHVYKFTIDDSQKNTERLQNSNNRYLYIRTCTAGIILAWWLKFWCYFLHLYLYFEKKVLILRNFICNHLDFIRDILWFIL